MDGGKNAFMRSFGVLLSLSLIAGSALAGEGETIRTILARSRRAYEQLDTYKDSGVVLYSDRSGEVTHRKTFRTAYEHPRRLFFEWGETIPFCDEKDRHVLWSDGECTWHFWSHVNQYKEETSLDIALAGAKYTSGYASHTIPLILLLESMETAPYNLEETRLLPDDETEGVPCTVVEGILRGGKTLRLWISQEDNFIRKIERRREKASGELEVVTEIHRDIHANVDLPEETFAYDTGEATLVREFRLED
jgi:outer membrane lipoprotein-sorting protein